ncbi:unnamed protein product, partial [Leptidea sinapis]
MSDWSATTILTFLEAYQNEPCLWNPKDADHKDRQKVNDAWTRLSIIMNKSVKELKTKKEILTNGYVPQTFEEKKKILFGPVQDPMMFIHRSEQPLPTPKPVRRRPATDTAERQMSSAFGQLTNILSKRQREYPPPPPKEDVDCELYGKLVAKKLRELSPDERKLF